MNWVVHPSSRQCTYTMYPDSRQCTAILSSLIHPWGCISWLTVTVLKSILPCQWWENGRYWLRLITWLLSSSLSPSRRHWTILLTRQHLLFSLIESCNIVKSMNLPMSGVSKPIRGSIAMVVRLVGRCRTWGYCRVGSRKSKWQYEKKWPQFPFWGHIDHYWRKEKS